MMNRTRWSLALALAAGAGLGVAAGVWGQTGERPLQKLFGGGSGSAKTTPAKVTAEAARRRAEIDLELAWLADPITFPYFLEARIDGGTLAVRGYVPDKLVREHALKLARVHTTHPITDNMKEHPSLRVRLAKESPAQLQAAVLSTLREAVPRQFQRLQVQCSADGAVTLRGPITSAEEKLAASHALRRLYGCSCVQNLTQIPGEPELTLGNPLPTVKDQPPPKKESPPIVEGPSLLPPRETVPAEKNSEPAKEAPAKEAPVKEAPGAGAKILMAADKIDRLQKRVLEVCAGAKDVKIEVTPMSKIRIELTVRSDDQITPFAGKVYGLPELMDYRDAVELYFTVAERK